MGVQLLRKTLLSIGFAALCSISACAAPVYDDPVAVMLDREQGFSHRMSAAHQARQNDPQNERYWQALDTMLWSGAHPESLRLYAARELLAHDPQKFKADISRRMTLLNNWAILELLFDTAVDRGWQDLTPTIVRNYARPAKGFTDDRRPEVKVLAALNPGMTTQQIVFNVFADSDDTMSVNEQVAAWELLCRLTSLQERLNLLEQAPDRTPLVIDLKAAARDLKTLPRHKEGVLWLSHLRSPEQADVWKHYAHAVAQLSPAQRENLELRHLPVLVQLDDSVRSKSRAQLESLVSDEVARSEHHFKGPTYDGGSKTAPQRLYQMVDRLSWADLATLHVLMHAMRDRAVVSQFFAQADRDLEDTSTEYGGVLLIDGGRARAVLHKPTVRMHDLKFVPTDAMVEQMYTSLAHYHFHAQDEKNSDYAGPGLGDLRLVERLDPNCLVLTFIDRDRLNVDYYQPGGVVIDLCTLQR